MIYVIILTKHRRKMANSQRSESQKLKLIRHAVLNAGR